MALGLTPKRINTNFSNSSYQKVVMQKRLSNANVQNEAHEIFFDGNFNPFM